VPLTRRQLLVWVRAAVPPVVCCRRRPHPTHCDQRGVREGRQSSGGSGQRQPGGGSSLESGEEGERQRPRLGFGCQQRRWRAAERHHPTGCERMGTAALQTLQEPILLLPRSAFEGSSQTPTHARRRTHPVPPSPPSLVSWDAHGFGLHAWLRAAGLLVQCGRESARAGTAGVPKKLDDGPRWAYW
jgi:hypothetical protein